MKKIKTLIAAAVLGLGVTVSSISPCDLTEYLTKRTF